MNNAVYEIRVFMVRAIDAWRWTHTRHHTDTVIVGRDPEIVAMRPTDRTSAPTISRFST